MVVEGIKAVAKHGAHAMSPFFPIQVLARQMRVALVVVAAGHRPGPQGGRNCERPARQVAPMRFHVKLEGTINALNRDSVSVHNEMARRWGRGR